MWNTETNESIIEYILVYGYAVCYSLNWWKLCKFFLNFQRNELAATVFSHEITSIDLTPLPK